MSKKLYYNNGYKIIYKKFVYVFNQELEAGYDWYVSSSSTERGEAIGIKRKDNKKTMQTVKDLNTIRNQFKLYLAL